MYSKGNKKIFHVDAFLEIVHVAQSGLEFIWSIGRHYCTYRYKKIAIISETYIRFYTYFLCATFIFVLLLNVEK